MNRLKIILGFIGLLVLGAGGGLIVIADDAGGDNVVNNVLADTDFFVPDDSNGEGDFLDENKEIGGADWSIHVFDVGQGDSIFLELPHGVQVLVDGGPDDSVLTELGKVMKPWDRYIDYVVATHPHADHIVGLVDVLERYDVGHIVVSDIEYDSVAWRVFWEAAEAEEAPILDPRDLDRMISGVVDVDVLYPSWEIEVDGIDNVNEMSTVLKVSDGEHSALLMADIGFVVEDTLVDLGLVEDVDVLKVGHQGSKFSSCNRFLDTIKPEIGIIPVGAENSYHHPHPSALRRLHDASVEVFRTDKLGSIEVVFGEGGIGVVY